MPNAFAYLMLGLWPLVAIVLYQRLDPARALIWCILGGYLLLPPLTAFAMPLVPDLDKVAIPNLMAGLLTLVILKDRIAILPQGAIGRLLLVMFVLSPFATVLTNPAPVPTGVLTLPGLRIYDSAAAVANQFIAILPFFLARRYLATPAAMRAICVALVVAGAAYSLPMLLEVRLSPQMNTWIYGFFQHSFEQMMRQGGFRPIVFLPHGLWAALFAFMALMAAAGLLRVGPADQRATWLAATIWMAGVLVLCKSAGALTYALLLVPVVLMAGRKLQMLLAATLAAVVITYPLLRGAGLIPIDDVLEFARSMSAERAQSLEYRIINENLLLERAAAQPLFGWGGYGRNLLYDPATGAIWTIPDGAWIIVLGTYGWLGYLAQFGLLVLPLLMLGRAALRLPQAALCPFAATIALIFAANLVDLLPNATLIPFTWLMAGALLGYAEAARATDDSLAPAAVAPAAAQPRTVL